MTEQGAGARGRVGAAAGIGGGLLLLAFGAAWMERKPVVRHFAARALARDHVPAQYRLAAVGPFRQRLEDVTIGDPAAPDLRARVVELTLGYDLHGPHLVGVRADGVRLRARLAGGRVSLGAIDRLLPAPSGQPLALPRIALDLRDAGVTLATAAGTVTARIEGSGPLADGFRGQVAATSPALATGRCLLERPRADMAVRIADGRPAVSGPVAVAAARCGAAVRLGEGRVVADLRFGRALNRWTGTLAPAGFTGRVDGARFGAVGGTIGIAGDPRRIAGGVRLTLDRPAAPRAAARSARATGRYRFAAGSGLVFAGDVAVAHAAADPALRRAVAARGGGLRDTPLGPALAQGASAVAALLADADATATLALTAGGPAGAAVKLRRLLIAARSGGRVRIDAGDGIGWAVHPGGWRVDGRVAVTGGGLPTLDAVLHQPRAGAPVAGHMLVTPYVAGASRIALTPVDVVTDGRRTTFRTQATVSGPFSGGGRVEALTVPLTGRVSPGSVVVNESCVPVSVRQVTLASLRLEPARVALCGIAGAPLIAVDTGIRAGVELPDLQLAGRLGDTPLLVTAGRFRATDGGFEGKAMAARLGRGDGDTELAFDTLGGVFVPGLTGVFVGGAGKIGQVPLRLSDATGSWRYAAHTLSLAGALALADVATPARFRRMRGTDVTLRLTGARIDATGTLMEPTTGTAVATVALTHDLSSGTGGTTLTVPGLAFGKAFQPDLLTPLTLGVVANVTGTVTGAGRIAWGPAGVTSTGDFATDRIDLAAAFGPVTGIRGRIHFSDLLGLTTPPHQQATVAEINPGVAVPNGVVRYQLLPDQRVAVEEARWPFAGGMLTLAPTLLSFSAGAERRMTFALAGVDAAAFVQQLDLPNVAATGTFDGTLPMVFDDTGGRIAGGAIVARPPGGSLAYVGEVSSAALGLGARLAFDALKAIRYSSLRIELAGRLDGEMVTRVAFTGVREATPDSGLAARLIHGLPFRFNIAVHAPFRALAGTARSYADPSLLLQGGANLAIQPSASEPVR